MIPTVKTPVPPSTYPCRVPAFRYALRLSDAEDNGHPIMPIVRKAFHEAALQHKFARFARMMQPSFLPENNFDIDRLTANLG